MELENHLGLNDKARFRDIWLGSTFAVWLDASTLQVLAEFIIELADEHSTVPSFKKALAENGADFEESFVSSLLNLIQKLRPPKSKRAVSDGGTLPPQKAEKVGKFPSLSMENTGKYGRAAEVLSPAAPSRTPGVRDASFECACTASLLGLLRCGERI